MQAILQAQSAKHLRRVPTLKPGLTVRVHQILKEGEKDRIQIFEGLVIGLHRGRTPLDATFTVRKIVEGVGVERVFPLYSPLIDRIEVIKEARVRRAKLTFLRGRSGKSARMSERFTESDEFATAVLTTPHSSPATDPQGTTPVDQRSLREDNLLEGEKGTSEATGKRASGAPAS